MSKHLPDHVDPTRLALSSQTLKGRLPLSSMHRLTSSLADAEGTVDVELAFGLGALPPARQVPLVKGRIQTRLNLVCQRCLQVMQQEVDLRVTLGVIKSMEEANYLPPDCEPLLMEEEHIFPAVVVEDELILALPVVPMHKSDLCHPKQDKTAQTDIATEVKKNPFAVLATLKKLS